MKSLVSWTLAWASLATAFQAQAQITLDNDFSDWALVPSTASNADNAMVQDAAVALNVSNDMRLAATFASAHLGKPTAALAPNLITDLFRSSAHPAGPNEPSCLELNIYVAFCFKH